MGLIHYHREVFSATKEKCSFCIAKKIPENSSSMAP